MAKVLMLAAVFTAAVGPVRAEETPAMEWPNIYAALRRADAAIEQHKAKAARTVARSKAEVSPQKLSVDQVIGLSRRMTYLDALMLLEDYSRKRRGQVSARDLTLLLEEVGRSPLRTHGYRDIEYQANVIDGAGMDWAKVTYGEMVHLVSAMVSEPQRNLATEMWFAARRIQ